MKSITLNEHEFRIKKLNAIEVLAMRNVIDFENFHKCVSTFDTILEKFEVKVKDKFMPVKDGSNYYPAGIEDDLDSIQTLISFFINDYMRPLFQSSSESKK